MDTILGNLVFTRITDSTGNIIANYYYDDWGKLVETTGDTAIANLNPIRYRSYYFDTETGFYQTGTRYYDPEISRFINADSVVTGVGESVQGYNLFAYCFNNPINFIDQNGDWPNFIKRVVHTVKTFVNTILSPFKATEVSISAGVGIGVQAKSSYNGSNLKVEAVAKNADSINWSKKGVDVRNTSTAGVTLTVGHMNKSFNYTKGHSYHDKNCTCNVFKDSFNKK